MSKELMCRICGNNCELNDNEVRKINGLPLYECGNCGTVYSAAKLEDLQNNTSYDDLFKTSEYECHRIEFDKLIRGKKIFEFHRQNLLRKIENEVNSRSLVEIGGGAAAMGNVV